ncbi:MAG: two-component sensor histidine kinase, partial [Chloroflexia bacterium]|nr:two-component sensor histidine kinase [Chloroflexia bacterium]
VVTHFEPIFQANQVELELEVEPYLPAVWSDPDRIDQVMINVLSNAFRYTPSGGKVTVRAAYANPMVKVSVQDTGVGIAPEHLPHVFERFYRVDKSRARQSGGNGIGLAIVRHLIDVQGGEIWAESAGPGTGTTISFTLPLPPGASEALLHHALQAGAVEAP